MQPDHIHLRFLRPHGAYRRGDIIEYPAGPAKCLIAASVCERVVESQPLIETAAVEQRGETADATPRRKRR